MAHPSTPAEKPGSAADRQCLFCAAEIPASAKKCRYCGEWQKPITKAPGLRKDGWEKFEVLGKVLSLVLIPIAVALLGNSVNKALKASDVNLEMVRLAVEILQANPSKEAIPLRKWAISLINENSRTPIGESASEELLVRPLPSNDPAITKARLYRETMQIVSGLIASDKVPSEEQVSVSRFWELYRKELIGVESREVATKMIDFGDQLKDLYGQDKSESLKTTGDAVIQQMRDELAKSEEAKPGS